MHRYSWFLAAVLASGSLTGCVEQRFVVNSDPPGAVVYRNGHPLGATPADDHFVYYGKHKFTLVKDGHQTLQVEQEVPAPWYMYPPFDFIAENLVPWTISDVRRFNYRMEPLKAVRSDELLNQAQNQRNRGHSLQGVAAREGP